MVTKLANLINTKDYYISNAPEGWKWVGCGDLPFTHIFQSGDYKNGFKVIECSELCITNGSLQFLIKYNCTYTKEKLRDLSKECEEFFR